MSFRFLLVNPWIYDFAAYNFWARPLGLLKVAEFFSRFNFNLILIDCSNSFNPKKYGTGKYETTTVEKPEKLKAIPRKYKRYGISENLFTELLKKIGKVDLILITSIMSYWWHGIKHCINILRDIFKDTPIIVGGIYATLYKEHAERNIDADYIYTGEIDDRIKGIIEKFGINLKEQRDKRFYWWQMGFYKDMPYAPLLTSTGCPFRCYYCASSLLNQTFKQRHKEEVIEEIKGLYKLGVRDFAFYDDALLFNADIHIKPILRELIKERLSIRFHTPNGLHARFIDEELALLMRQTGFKTLRLSLETVDIKRQIESSGKVTNDDIERAVFYLKKAGFSSQEIGIYIMYGLPEQSLDEVRRGIEFIKKLKVRVHLTEFSPIKGTYYWQVLVKKGVIPDDLDPLMTNNSIFSELFCQYDKKELAQIKIDVNKYNLLI
ncbi:MULTISPECIES: B12-binding domain-containing radical SAM protein [Thermodesulfovibrio]|jgi:radical SAM superfamily enzyme YgiQ (UPF0313 family)|uniref:B12-binding domain-containing radical SAM protein n=1 Tax=Thermodesulfovibrio TaxID=28261 RepID=UPI00261FB970|nr:B12-binding domain-containing radical SAM protein [Thermodesulfovibrio sp.]